MKLNYVVWSIGLPMILLTLMSLLVLNSVAPSFAANQLMFVIVSLVLMVLIARIDYHTYTFSPWPWYVLTLSLLGLTFLLGEASHGAVRWINVAGMTLQTSELVKPMMILFMGIYLVQKPPQRLMDVIKYLTICMVPALLIFLQPDLGTALILIFLSMLSLIAAGVRIRQVLILALIGIILLPIGMSLLKPYQRQRLESFVNPTSDPLGAGYNSLQATIAVGSGKIIGRGLGQGTQSHLRFLPERYSDFIYASLVEELGFLGGAIILFLYLWLAYGLLKAARLSNSDLGSIVLLMTLSLILIQTVVNVGMNMGVLPITGITLPLISSGGSSYVSLAILIGICISIARQPSQNKAELELK